MFQYFKRGHGVAIGSETSGGIRNVLIESLTLNGTDRGKLYIFYIYIYIYIYVCAYSNKYIRKAYA